MQTLLVCYFTFPFVPVDEHEIVDEAACIRKFMKLFFLFPDQIFRLDKFLGKKCVYESLLGKTKEKNCLCTWFCDCGTLYCLILVELTLDFTDNKFGT